jgi:hypothetical protein
VESEKIYLVLARVALISGQEIVSVDAFRATDANEATNMARNFFTQERGGVIVYGDHSIFSDTICSLVANVVGVLDLEDEENQHWLDSIDVFDRFLTEESKKASTL